MSFNVRVLLPSSHDSVGKLNNNNICYYNNFINIYTKKVFSTDKACEGLNWN